jgi:hypothetical protein
MSRATQFARHGRQQTDQAVSRVYRSFSSRPARAATFGELLQAARDRSPFLARPEVRDGRHLQVDALRNLVGFRREFLRPVSTWPGANGSVLCVVASLARHLLARYDVPKFLASAWFGGDGPTEEARRHWYVEHSRGRRFRDLALPMEMTRRMEHLFLSSPDHLSVPRAMRRAELITLGASRELADAVLATRLGEHLSHGRFWRSFLRLLVRESAALELSTVAPMVDFLQAIRHEWVEGETDDGPALLPPPQPGFSLKGRTLASLLRRVHEWHRSLDRVTGVNLRWEPSRERPMICDDPPVREGLPPVRWEFVELTCSHDLRREGRALQHCVSIYDWMCRRGRSRIWSLRRQGSRGRVRSVVTIEIDPWRRWIVQARGLRNRPVSGRPLGLLRAWARRENLELRV